MRYDNPRCRDLLCVHKIVISMHCCPVIFTDTVALTVIFDDLQQELQLEKALDFGFA